MSNEYVVVRADDLAAMLARLESLADGLWQDSGDPEDAALQADTTAQVAALRAQAAAQSIDPAWRAVQAALAAHAQADAYLLTPDDWIGRYFDECDVTDGDKAAAVLGGLIPAVIAEISDLTWDMGREALSNAGLLVRD